MRLSRYFLPAAQGNARRGADRLAPADAARRHDPPGGGRHLRVAAARLRGPEEHRAHRARGNGPRRRDRAPDADAAARRSLARERTLRRVRSRDAAHPRSPRARAAVRADQRGHDHRDLPRERAFVSQPADEPLPHAVEVPRRAAPAVRRHARPRIPDEGCVFVRSGRSRRAPRVQPHVRRVPAHVRAHGPQGDSDARGNRADRRRSFARVHRARRDRRIGASIATGACWICRFRARTSTTRRISRR